MFVGIFFFFVFWKFFSGHQTLFNVKGLLQNEIVLYYQNRANPSPGVCLFICLNLCILPPYLVKPRPVTDLLAPFFCSNLQGSLNRSISFSPPNETSFYCFYHADTFGPFLGERRLKPISRGKTFLPLQWGCSSISEAVWKVQLLQQRGPWIRGQVNFLFYVTSQAKTRI